MHKRITIINSRSRLFHKVEDFISMIRNDNITEEDIYLNSTPNMYIEDKMKAFYKTDFVLFENITDSVSVVELLTNSKYDDKYIIITNSYSGITGLFYRLKVDASIEYVMSFK